MKRLRSWMMAGLAGAGVVYFLDPDRGARRRNIARDRTGSIFRRLLWRSERMSRFAAGNAYGVVQETVPHRRDNPNPDDKTLKDRVETEIFRPADAPKGDINIDVVDGVVELRGQLPDTKEINTIVERVQKIPNVRDVRSFLHPPGTPAPNKQEVEQVSR